MKEIDWLTNGFRQIKAGNWIIMNIEVKLRTTKIKGQDKIRANVKIQNRLKYKFFDTMEEAFEWAQERLKRAKLELL